MSFVLVFLLVCGVLLVVTHQLLHYPARLSEWRFAFGGEHRDARRALHQAHRRRRALEANARRGESALEKRVKEITKAGRKSERALEKERDALLEPGHGVLVEELGPLQLYQHALLYFPETAEGEDASGDYEETDLADLSADTNFGRENSFIKVRDRYGEILTAQYPRYRYEEGDVQDFCDLINDEALADRTFRSDQRSEAAEVASRIRRVRAETDSAVEAARRDVDELVEAHRVDPQRKQAEEDWEAQCQTWQERTGRRPRWRRWLW